MNESIDERLSNEEFAHLVELLRRYTATELDQFDHWKLDLPNCTVYVDISFKPLHGGTEDFYTDLNNLAKL